MRVLSNIILPAFFLFWFIARGVSLTSVYRLYTGEVGKALSGVWCLSLMFDFLDDPYMKQL